MRIVRKINNNVAVGVDADNREVVLFGKGIGFPTLPYELTDLAKIDRTFYDVDEKYYKLFDEIDSDLINFVGHMVDVIQSKKAGHWDKRLTFILADHINFSIQRLKNGMRVDFPYSYEIERDFPEFNKFAIWIVKNINKRMNVTLEKGEITCIAMHLMSAYEGTCKDEEESKIERSTRIINEVTMIIEDYFHMTINRQSLNYYRFRYHIQYFIKRKDENEEIFDDNAELFESMKKMYPEAYQCVCKIEEYIKKEFVDCSKDELLYLMIHINRLYSKEDCNRKGITPDEN